MLTVVIFGATGDLAKKKLFPALYELLYGCPDAPLLPRLTQIVGYGRAQMELGAFVAKQCANVTGPHRDEFVSRISYAQGQYDQEADFARLNRQLLGLEADSGAERCSRLFFLSVPPTVFGQVCDMVHRQARAVSGFTRLIIEKPFGRDSRTFAELNDCTSRLFREDQLYRIDHYLAKEKVLNLVAFRFANQLYEPLWNRKHIAQVQIIFKEDIGTDGRGGYFDGFGIIRDIMQNHLLQVFLWLAMEAPEGLDAPSIAKEKLRLLAATRTLEMKDCFLGQYAAGAGQPGYLDDETVPAGSRCPTYAAAVLNVDNDRWRGVPFIMRAGKALNERLAEVRVTFKKQTYNSLLPGEPNELVLRIQPDEGVYLRCINKQPGWSQAQTVPVHMKMSYRDAFPVSYSAGAYERMLLNAAKGEQSLFVGAEELVEAWRVFTPLLDEIDSSRPQPVLYPFGSVMPEGLKDFAQARGVDVEDTPIRAVLADASPLRKTSKSSLMVTPLRPRAAEGPGLPVSEEKKKAGDGRASAAAGAAEGTEGAEVKKGTRRDAPADEVGPTPPRKWRRLKSHGTF